MAEWHLSPGWARTAGLLNKPILNTVKRDLSSMTPNRTYSPLAHRRDYADELVCRRMDSSGSSSLVQKQHGSERLHRRNKLALIENYNVISPSPITAANDSAAFATGVCLLRPFA